MVGSIIVDALIKAGTLALTAGSTAAAAAAIAINFVVSTIVTRMFGPNLDANQSTNNREQVPPTTDNAIPIVYGDAYIGGTFVDACLSTNQQWMYYTLAISSISPNGQFTFDTTKFYYGNRLITFDGTDQAKVVSLTDEAGNVDTKINDNLWINLFTSNAAGTITPINTGYLPHQIMGATSPSPVYNANKVPAAQQWPSTGRQMNGTAFAIVVLQYNAQEGITGLEPITFKVKQALNGTGVAKPGDVWYDYMTSSVYGAAVGASYVDSASATTLNTYSDQTIAYTPSGGGSATQARYRINGVLSGNIPCLDNIDKILTACDSWMTYNAALGQWSIVVNKAESASLTFDDTDIVGEIRVSATDITQSVNQIEARFPNKDNKDQSGFVLLTTPSGLLYPNEPVNKTSVTYDLVNDSVQAQYLANRVLEQAREDLIVSFNTTYYGIQADAGDVVSVTNADYGWSSKLFRVMKVNETSLPDGQLGARLELSEYSAAVYDDATITAYTPVSNSGLPAPQFFSTVAAPTVIASRPSATAPSFDIQVSVPTTGRVTYIILYASTTATPTASDYKEIARQTLIDGIPFTNSTNFSFLNLFLSSGTYYFSAIVGNESGQSAKSALSSAFAWSPLPTSNARKTATAIVYKWFNTAPALPTGTSTYTWSTDSFLPPSGWTLLAGTSPGSAYVLVSASVDISAIESDLTTTITWSQSRLLLTETNAGSVYSPRVAFARVAGTITQTYGTITTTGTASVPSSAQSLSTWGFSATWTAADPDPTSVNPLYRTDGTYNATLDQVVWTTPYIATLRVGTLSALSTDTGDLTVSGNITMDSYGAIKGGQTDFATGTGFFLGYSGSAYKFSIGTSTSYLQWNGTQLNISGTGKFAYNNSTTVYTELGLDGNGSVTRIYRSVGTILPPFYILDTATTGGAGAAWINSDSTNSESLRLDSDATGATVPTRTLIINVADTKTKAIDVLGGNIETNKTIRSTGVNAPTTGTGIEIAYSSGVGYVVSYDRATSTSKPFEILSSSTTLGGTSAIPATSTSTGSVGQIAWDASYIYVCVSSNSWRRVALSTF